MPLPSGRYWPHPRRGGVARHRLHTQDRQMNMVAIFEWIVC